MRKKFGLTEDGYKKSKIAILAGFLLIVSTTAVLLFEYMYGDTLINMPFGLQAIVFLGLLLMIVLIGVEIGK